MKPLIAVVLCALATGCAHQVTFERPAAYSISTPRHDLGVTAVIDQQTLANKVPVRAFMTGIAHSWEVEPGDMLKQIADIELPQMFAHYDFSNTYKEPTHYLKWINIELAIPSYRFQEFGAKVSVSINVYEPGKRPLLQKTYSAEGETHGAKMFWAGPFGMKSAIRQSSLDAYKRIFAELRSDLAIALQSKSGVSPVATAVPDMRGDSRERMNRPVEPKAPPSAKVGKFTFEAEHFAKAERCAAAPTATLTATGPGFENYSVPCADGDALAVRCEMGNCRALR
jgi:hypothetical protein